MKSDPLKKIDELVPWETFRPALEAVWRRPPKERKSNAGRKPSDTEVMFKAIVLCELYNLSDDQVGYELCDRLSFILFLGLGLQDKVPDATVWLYREKLAQAGKVEELFEAFERHLKDQDYLAMGGRHDRIRSYRRVNRAGSQAAQPARGERADQGGGNA